jgi:hypothetical protein
VSRTHTQRPRRREQNQDSITKRLFTEYRSGAKRRGINFDIEYSLFKRLIQRDCYLCGKPPATLFKRSQKTAKRFLNMFMYYNGLDRINNKIGYTNENVKPCCAVCNKMKGTIDKKEFLEHIENIKSGLSKKTNKDKLK